MSTTPDHWSDCSVYNEPAYPAGPCDCMPTPAMCRAAVEYMNGPEVYDMLPDAVLEIEEGIYREVWRAMQKAAPPQHTGERVECDMTQMRATPPTQRKTP